MRFCNIVSFCAWFISHKSSKSIHFIASNRISFFHWMNDISLFVYTAHFLSIHPLMKTKVVSVPCHSEECRSKHGRDDVCLQHTDFVFFGCMSSSRIAGSYGSSTFNFFRNFHTAFHNVCTNLLCHQHCTRILCFPYLCQHLLSFLGFQISKILSDIRLIIINASKNWQNFQSTFKKKVKLKNLKGHCFHLPYIYLKEVINCFKPYF